MFIDVNDDIFFGENEKLNFWDELKFKRTLACTFRKIRH